MKIELDKAYEAKKFEDDIYQEWLNSGYFNPDNLQKRNNKSFSIVLPPPNVTGQLHIGHAAMLAYQDLIVRYHRMRGDKTLWLPGMDHAAIATQTVVDKKLKAKGIDRHEIGREKFLEEVDNFVQESKTVIKNQLQKMGSSLDWSRERYTMDKGITKEVQHVFRKLYEDGLIYRGERVINWCPHCKSTLADDEVEHREQNTKLYYFKYSKDFPITIATSRPETKLGDTAVAVNPKDERYKKYIGKTFDITFCGIKLHIKIIADRNVDMNFGTGALGVTPAHSAIDADLAKEHNLKIIKVIDKDGKILPGFGKFSGLNTKEASKKIIEELKKNKLIEKIDEYNNNLSICYRCDTPIEPMPLEQWFVNVNKKIKSKNNKTLKQLSTEVVKNGSIKIIPQRFDKVYFEWMNNLKDWCISRQLWFGHRMPVWYKDKEIWVPKTITELYVMRHGATDWNKEGKIQGKTDVPIDEDNVKNIEKIAENLKNEKFDIIISSTQKRARQTAEIINQKLNITLLTNELLVERDYAGFEGKEAKKVAKEYPEYKNNKIKFDIPGEEESYDDMKKRVEKFLEYINKNYSNKKILIITHNAVIRTFNIIINELNDEEASKYKLQHEKIEKYQILDGKYKIKDWKQDPDTLDTWFSSALWTFTTLGGPNKTKDLKDFHPTSVMETGYDILFFWVARMILLTTYILDDIPFHTVYLHGLVRDKNGKKMSKSLGNGIDPLDVIKKYGADALRLSMIIGSTPGNDVKLYDEKISGYRNFINKLWNISRYILTNIENPKLIEKKPEAITLSDKWILDELDKIIYNTTLKIENFQFSPAGEDLYEFTWNKLADWYIEISKLEKSADAKAMADKDEILLYILQNLLKLWHPFTPYITEVIWKNFSNELLLIQKWPEVKIKLSSKKYKENKKVKDEFFIIQNIITEIRKFKNINKIDPAKIINCHIESKKYEKLIKENSKIIEILSRIKLQNNLYKEKIHIPNIDIYIEIIIDKKETEKQIIELEKYINTLETKLANKQFIDNAPNEIVEAEKKKLRDAKELLNKLK
ncbi:MAG: class I tRNA ligase family protein [Patescibacteria group bacterium]|nr:class I tRNA ligase family protein [Patescibacteria group bacterium]MDD4303937.1 class I tRNA ligase family protein [Patescibacteria group bacterium]MDD4695075.1 class I tRNA ligase family protein [Patescibacteria group bacterium]